jgi:hypothetical protein
MYVYICVCVYVYMYMCMYVYVYSEGNFLTAILIMNESQFQAFQRFSSSKLVL